MKTTEEKLLNQISLQNKMVTESNINLVNCGSCGSVMLHEVIVLTQDVKEKDYEIECPFCGFKSEPCDFPDYFYEDMELSDEFKKL